tara:strand:+ start:148 stop:906 length:759 start_codon:yes stop_codon:yes gene_type:complete
MSLKDIVDEYIAGLTDGDVTYGTRRTTIVKKAKHAVRQMSFCNLKEYKDVELDLSTTLQVLLPSDFVDYGSIYWVDENGLLYPLAQNKKISVAKGILQDSDYNYIYDNNGELVLVQGRKPEYDKYSDVPVGNNTDYGQHFSNGGFRVDKEHGYIQFDSTAAQKAIVLSYISDGIKDLDDSVIKINRLAADAINNYIYHLLIKRNVKVAQSEKVRARRDFLVSRRVLDGLLNPVREEDFLQTNKSRSRQVKQQ